MPEMTIKVFGPIDANLVNAISTAMDNLSGCGKLNIVISSPGGETSAGVTAYNLIKLPCSCSHS